MNIPPKLFLVFGRGCQVGKWCYHLHRTLDWLAKQLIEGLDKPRPSTEQVAAVYTEWVAWYDFAELEPFCQRQDEFVVEAGCLLWWTKLVVPGKLQLQVFRELHSSHPGMIRMKRNNEGYIQWPGVNIDSEEMCSLPSVWNHPPSLVAMAHQTMKEGTNTLWWALYRLHILNGSKFCQWGVRLLRQP